MNLAKNKTIAAWLAFLGGIFGLHRFYLRGLFDVWAWLHPIPTALGVYGLQRVQQFGQDDALSWILIPIFGFHFAHTALVAIYYGLMSREKWNAKFELAEASTAGATNWATIFAIVLSLLIGTTVLMASIVYSFQRYFEVQIEEARKISQ
jgi:TM2 domain